ncbi:hypothetical protein DVA86_15085 [Streptomyces armeniacus]|uniref:Uncharacterized protein n=1 Tax=Streptomyces armeniacus TaxID=83291 RepID=A0A345XQ69_9ACTN|nr:hypothetical protein [Streptomyces armeniacus]AXK33785.1 hypothetical protein DVA86_15085 [Streptomyces armeniacus]
MDPVVVIVCVLGLALLAAAAVEVRARRAAGGTSRVGGGRTGRTGGVPDLPPCVFCRRPFRETDQVAGFKEEPLRELMGGVPVGHPAVTDPAGNRRWLGHAECAGAAGADLDSAAPIGGPSRQAPPEPPGSPEPSGPPQPGGLACPVCEHRFTPPAITVITKADRRRYGRDPVQCPSCDYIWNARRKTRTIRG